MFFNGAEMEWESVVIMDEETEKLHPEQRVAVKTYR